MPAQTLAATGGVVPSGVGSLAVWLRADLGITYVQGAVTSAGTTPPAVTLTGTPVSSSTTLEIDITTLGARGVAIFQWKLNGVVQQTSQTTAATFVLGTTGITANFPTGTYATNNVYTSFVVVSSWVDQIGGHAFVQVTSASRPAYTTSDAAYNNCPSLSFVPALTNNLVSSSFAIPQPFTLVAVSKTTTAGANGIFGSVGTVACLYNETNTPFLCASTNLGYGSTSNIVNAMVGVANGASSTIYVDSSTVGVVNGAAGAAGISGGMSVGDPDGIGLLTGSIAELMAFSGTLNVSQVSSVLSYLGTRYGTAWS